MTHLLGHGGECSKTKLVSTSMRSKAVDQKHVTKNARNADRFSRSGLWLFSHHQNVGANPNPQKLILSCC